LVTHPQVVLEKRKTYLRGFNSGRDKGTNISSFLLENVGRRKTMEKLKFSQLEKEKEKIQQKI
jgi:hypothetical protein